MTGLALQSFFRVSFDKSTFSNYTWRFQRILTVRFREAVDYGVSSKSILSIFKDIKHIVAITMKVGMECGM